MANSCCNQANDPCTNGKPDARCVIYTGANLPCIGATTNMNLEEILQLLEDEACESGTNLTYNNWITRTDNLVQFGGSLVQDTAIDFSTFNVNITNIPRDDNAPFLLGKDISGNWVEVSASVFATQTPAFTLPSTTAHNGLSYSFDMNTFNYDVILGGTLDQDTSIDFSTFNLALLNVPTGTPTDFLTLDGSGNIITSPFASLLTFQNALTETSNVVEWGGTLLHDTAVNQATFDINFTNGDIGIKTAADPAHTLTIGDDGGTTQVLGIYAPNGTEGFIEALSAGQGITIAAKRTLSLHPNYGSGGELILNNDTNAGLEVGWFSGGQSKCGEIGLSLFQVGVSNEFYIKAHDTGTGPQFRNGFLTFYGGDGTLSVLIDSGGKFNFQTLYNLPVVSAPASPVDGDVWRQDNTNTGVKIRVNGVTKTFTLS